MESVGAGDEDGIYFGRSAKGLGRSEGADAVLFRVAGGFRGVPAMEADEGGLLAVAEGRHEAKRGVVAKAEDGKADGLHESPVPRMRCKSAACDHVKA